jgi:hypothetical protein
MECRRCGEDDEMRTYDCNSKWGATLSVSKMRGNELKDPRYCHNCHRELSFSERDLFYDNEFALCRDCWINKTFKPINPID